MTESKWLACEGPGPLLAFLKGRVGDRKLRLFMAACCRRIWHLIEDGRARAAVEVAERFADGLIGEEELRRAEDASRETLRVPSLASLAHSAACWATVSPRRMSTSFASMTAGDASLAAAQAAGGTRPDAVSAAHEAEMVEQGRLVREVVGNPFRPVVLDPRWPAWNGGTARDLARGIDDELAFERMPILADALEEAGCTDAALLDHCRGPGPHVKGCWALDAILGRE